MLSEYTFFTQVIFGIPTLFLHKTSTHAQICMKSWNRNDSLQKQNRSRSSRLKQNVANVYLYPSGELVTNYTSLLRNYFGARISCNQEQTSPTPPVLLSDTGLDPSQHMEKNRIKAKTAVGTDIMYNVTFQP